MNAQVNFVMYDEAGVPTIMIWSRVFWTWDIPHYIREKTKRIMRPKGLDVVFA